MHAAGRVAHVAQPYISSAEAGGGRRWEAGGQASAGCVSIRCRPALHTAPIRPSTGVLPAATAAAHASHNRPPPGRHLGATWAGHITHWRCSTELKGGRWKPSCCGAPVCSSCSTLCPVAIISSSRPWSAAVGRSSSRFLMCRRGTTCRWHCVAGVLSWNTTSRSDCRRAGGRAQWSGGRERRRLVSNGGGGGGAALNRALAHAASAHAACRAQWSLPRTQASLFLPSR